MKIYKKGMGNLLTILLPITMVLVFLWIWWTQPVLIAFIGMAVIGGIAYLLGTRWLGLVMWGFLFLMVLSILLQIGLGIGNATDGTYTALFHVPMGLW